MVDGAGDVPRHGDQASLRAKDLEQADGRRVPRGLTPARAKRLGEFKGMAVSNGSLLPTPHHQLRAIGKQSFQPDKAGIHVVLLHRFL